jgi:hypothetical protein
MDFPRVRDYARGARACKLRLRSSARHASRHHAAPARDVSAGPAELGQLRPRLDAALRRDEPLSHAVHARLWESGVEAGSASVGETGTAAGLAPPHPTNPRRPMSGVESPRSSTPGKRRGHPRVCEIRGDTSRRLVTVGHHSVGVSPRRTAFRAAATPSKSSTARGQIGASSNRDDSTLAGWRPGAPGRGSTGPPPRLSATRCGQSCLT